MNGIFWKAAKRLMDSFALLGEMPTCKSFEPVEELINQPSSRHSLLWLGLFLVLAYSSDAFGKSAVSEARAFTESLPREFVLVHQEIDRVDRVRFHLEFGAYLNRSPIMNEFSAGSGIIEFYDRLHLAENSYFEVGEKRILLSCLWLNGQMNAGRKGPEKFARRLILVAQSSDCKGPKTDLGEDRWDTFVELTIFRPSVPALRDARMVLNGTSLGLALAPVPWKSRGLASLSFSNRNVQQSFGR